MAITETEIDVLTAYLLAVTGWWYVIIPGVLLSVIDGIERARGREVPIAPRWIIRVFVIGICLAQFLAYREMRKENKDAIASLAAENERLKSPKSDFRFRFSQVGSGPWNLKDDKGRASKIGDSLNDSVITIVGDIYNLGNLQSSARQWKLEVQPLGYSSPVSGSLIGSNASLLNSSDPRFVCERWDQELG